MDQPRLLIELSIEMRLVSLMIKMKVDLSSVMRTVSLNTVLIPWLMVTAGLLFKLGVVKVYRCVCKT